MTTIDLKATDHRLLLEWMLTPTTLLKHRSKSRAITVSTEEKFQHKKKKNPFNPSQYIREKNKNFSSFSCISFFLSEGANGDGMAIVSSLRSFDREQQKEYLIPIVIKDSGSPHMTGTSTLTVVIGDANDNKMQPGAKEIFVYNYAVSLIIKFFSMHISYN